jgi:hypothetical protein
LASVRISDKEVTFVRFERLEPNLEIPTAIRKSMVADTTLLLKSARPFSQDDHSIRKTPPPIAINYSPLPAHPRISGLEAWT